MGHDYPRMLDMSFLLRVDIVMYEYPGFGGYLGETSDQ